MRTPVTRHDLARPRRIRGQGMTEYIIIVALIALGAVAAIGYFGTAVNASFVSLGTTLTGGTAAARDTALTAGTAAGTAAQTAKTLGTYGN